MEQLNAVLPIKDIFSRVILNCEGQPAVETEVLAGDDVIGRVSVPGTKGQNTDAQEEAEYINTVIAGELTGKNIFGQEEIDAVLSGFDRETETLFSVSAAAASAAAAALKMPLYRYLGGVRAARLPKLEIRADGNVVILPPADLSLLEQLKICREAGRKAGTHEKAGISDRAADRRKDDRQGDVSGPVLRIMPGQTATLSELSRRIRKAQADGITVIFCSSEYETADTLMTDLAVAYGADRIDAGPVCHMENVEKYNRLLRISEKLEKKLT